MRTAGVYIDIAMKTIPHIAVETDVKSSRVVPQNSTSTHTSQAAGSASHLGETVETIEARATTVTVVLQQIMAYRTDFPHQHGGLND
jgi:DNA-directed RNA polymerase specialized sigma54-like protein